VTITLATQHLQCYTKNRNVIVKLRDVIGNGMKTHSCLGSNIALNCHQTSADSYHHRDRTPTNIILLLQPIECSSTCSNVPVVYMVSIKLLFLPELIRIVPFYDDVVSCNQNRQWNRYRDGYYYGCWDGYYIMGTGMGTAMDERIGTCAGTGAVIGA
jgi:hypothetical protein